ncbi:unnamed protein product [Brassicogethes aeneus]|uniref:Uncharacterized protein n=1 Tax=Brassicogethes aeneus TaxID=1431903 RepID=A0A9P0AR27_BRAAE|nr:unnamed protein product [Brassicogethes aeneus]
MTLLAKENDQGSLLRKRENKLEEANKEITEINEKTEDNCDNQLENEDINKNKQLVNRKWSLCSFTELPSWLQDNEYITFGHRPPIPCVKTCFQSIFRIHAETGNIWTHLVGCILFIGITVYFTYSQYVKIPDSKETWVFLAFFAGAILYLGFSTIFHTLYCHSQNVSKLFSKLDYCGISLLIMGSFVPWVYFGFYCHFVPKVLYLVMVCTLGISTMCVSLIDKFSTPTWRPFRAGVFMTFGLSAVFPALHYGFQEGWFNHISQKNLGWLVLMGVLYIAGALLYALRVPERWYPGKFDFWFHSHQIFHVFVVAAALVHFHGVTELATHRLSLGACDPPGLIKM